MTRLAVSITSPTIGQMQAEAEHALRAGADLVELRIDRLQSIDRDGLTGLVARLPAGRVIVTCRPSREGGCCDQDDTHRVELLAELARRSKVLLDVELSTWAGSAELRAQIRQGLAGDLSRLILSVHDFAARPVDPAGLIEQIRRANADGLAKLAWQAAEATDNLEALDLMRSGGRGNIVVCMGQAGVGSRVLARKVQAYLSYCSLRPGAEAAPGQVSLEQMKRLYRWDRIDGQTAVFAVVGWPLGHSLSPVVHNAAFGSAGINAVYLPMPVKPGYERLAAFVDGAIRRAWLGLRGLSVTIPHKVNALRLAGEAIEPLARRIGAVNTLIFEGRGNGSRVTARGINTDYAGALDALTAGLGCERVELRGLRCAVLGAGGAARAAVAGLRDCGCEVVIFNRTADKARRLAADFDCQWRPFEQRCQLQADIVINATSVGMHPAVEQTPLPAEALRPSMVVFDMVYNPMRTRLLREASEVGCRTISGVEMFVNQAALQFEAWTGQTAPRELMRQVVVEQLAGR